MSQPLSDEEEEVKIAIAVSELDGAGCSQTADWARPSGLRMSIQPRARPRGWS